MILPVLQETSVGRGHWCNDATGPAVYATIIMMMMNLCNLSPKVLCIDDGGVARVTRHSSSNSMDSKNLSICWWPTLMWPEITSMDTLMLTTRPLEELVQLMIDQHGFFFRGETEVSR